MSKAFRLIASQPSVFVAAVVATAVALMLSIAMLLVGQGARVELARGIDRTRLSIVVDPQLARGDAEALIARAQALPFVREAVLHAREDAFKALVETRLPALKEAANPLPDVVTIALRVPGPDRIDQPLTSYALSARDALAQLPGATSVELDTRWLGFIDRWGDMTRRAVATGYWMVFGILGVVVFCVFFLVGRAASHDAAADRTGPDGTVVAVSIAAVVCGIVGLLVAGGATSALLVFITENEPSVKPIVETFGRMTDALAGALTLLTLAVAAAAAAIGVKIVGDR